MQWASETIANRIIPTRMGTSKFILEESHAEEDHPHAYGDKANRLRVDICILGSSPRVWGQDCDIFTKDGATGIIPTRMGTRQTVFG